MTQYIKEVIKIGSIRVAKKKGCIKVMEGLCSRHRDFDLSFYHVHQATFGG